MKIYFSSFLAGGLLICTLLVLLALRFLVHKRAKVDSIVIASPFALVFVIFYILAYGINLFTISLFVLVFLVFLTNYRALQRFAAGLYVDYYHTYFSVASVIESIITIGLAVCLIIYAPVPDTPTKNYSIERTQLTGSATQGLQDKSELFQSIDGVLYEYIGDNGIDEKKPILLYVPDFFCQSKDFTPVLAAYARDGYKVFAADLYLNDVEYFSSILDRKIFRSFAFRAQKVYKPEVFAANLNNYIQKKQREIKTIKEYVENKYPNKDIYFLSDTYTNEAVKNLFFKENIIQYDWGGCGLLSQTLPLEYAFFMSNIKNN